MAEFYAFGKFRVPAAWILGRIQSERAVELQAIPLGVKFGRSYAVFPAKTNLAKVRSLSDLEKISVEIWSRRKADLIFKGQLHEEEALPSVDDQLDRLRVSNPKRSLVLHLLNPSMNHLDLNFLMEELGIKGRNDLPKVRVKTLLQKSWFKKLLAAITHKPTVHDLHLQIPGRDPLEEFERRIAPVDDYVAESAELAGTFGGIEPEDEDGNVIESDFFYVSRGLSDKMIALYACGWGKSLSAILSSIEMQVRGLNDVSGIDRNAPPLYPPSYTPN